MSQERNRLGNFAKDCADPQHYKLRLVRSCLMTSASAQRGLHRITLQIASTEHLRFNTRREIVVIAKFKIVVSAIIVSFSYAAPVFAQSFNRTEGTGNELPSYYDSSGG